MIIIDGIIIGIIVGIGIDRQHVLRARMSEICREIAMVISAADWRRPRSRDEGRARLIGRNEYNAWRRQAAGERREVVRELLLTLGWNRWGVLGEIALQLGVSRSCVCKDRQALERWW